MYSYDENTATHSCKISFPQGILSTGNFYKFSIYKCITPEKSVSFSLHTKKFTTSLERDMEYFVLGTREVTTTAGVAESAAETAAATTSWTYNLKPFTCLRDLGLWFPKALCSDINHLKAIVHQMTLTLTCDHYSFKDLPLSEVYKFKRACGGHRVVSGAHVFSPPTLTLTLSKMGGEAHVPLPLDILFPNGLVVCRTGALSLSFTASSPMDVDIVLVVGSLVSIRDAYFASSCTRISFNTINRKEVGQEHFEGPMFHTWVDGPMIAFAVSGAPKAPIKADVVTVGLCWSCRHRQLVGGRWGVFVTPDDVICTGGALVEFPMALTSLPTITTLKANFMIIGMGCGGPGMEVGPY